jgi:hypothetical protein
MFLKNFALLAALPAIFAISPAQPKTGLPGYGSGGRYGLKSCTNKGLRPGRVSCINFDSIITNATTGIGQIPKDYSALTFSPQFSIFNITTTIDTIPPQNRHSAASSPNALVGSRFNPMDKKDNSPASITVEEGAFDLFGFYLQPMGSPPPGATVYIKAYLANGGDPLEFSMNFPDNTKEPYYFDAERDAGPRLWDGLNKVEIWAGYGSEEVDWEFFVDDLWLRWSKEINPAITGHHMHSEELK